MSEHTTVTVTLGHNGLPIPASEARISLCDIFHAVDAQTLGTFLDGFGVWQDDAGAEQVETCDAWILTINTDAVNLLSAGLALAAGMLGQDAIGYIVHNHAARPLSYVEGVPS